MIYFAALAIFASLSMNLLLSFALGAAGAVGKSVPKNQVESPLPLLQIFFMFLSVLFLWIFFSFFIPPFWRGFSVIFLFFPLSAVMCLALERCFQRLFPKNDFQSRKIFSAVTAYEGLVPVSLMLTFTLAYTFAGALVLSLFFALGNLVAMRILNEIRRRSMLERLPRSLRGSPLLLISTGLLSLISASVAVIFFRMLDVMR